MELDANGFPVEIDLASERVFADEELVRAALMFPNLKSTSPGGQFGSHGDTCGTCVAHRP